MQQMDENAPNDLRLMPRTSSQFSKDTLEVRKHRHSNSDITQASSTGISSFRSSGIYSSSKKAPPKIRKVNDYIIFYDEILGKGQFGTVVKA